jgi:DNA primase large subunit
MDEDTRLEPILDNLSQGFIAGIGSEWSTGENVGEGIRAEMVDELARQHFPMCMRNLHENLKRNHHLKHFGRLQYGLFLKVRVIWLIWKTRSSYSFAHRFWVYLSTRL